MVSRAPDPSVSRRARSAARWAIAVGVVGFGLKLAGWLATGSVAVFSDALESIVNIVASVGALLALVYAERPPDEEHPYGHGPIEFVSALFEGVLVAVAGLVVLTHCAESVYRGAPSVDKLDLGLVLVAASAVLNGIAGVALLRVGRATGSAALIGDGRHLLSDLWTTAAVIAGLVAVRITGEAWIDTAVALGVGVLLVVVGTRVAFGGLSSILGVQDAEDHRRIVAVLEAHRAGAAPSICSYASVRHRHQGRLHFVDMHLRVPRDMTVADSHEIASAIEREVLAAVGEGTATAHMEPCGSTSCERCRAARQA
jgi:cation diffusion facilitator family transporter